MKKLFSFLMITILLFTLCFFSVYTENKQYTIGFSNVWVGNTYGIQGVNELEAFLSTNPQVKEYYIYNADNNVNKQISDIEDLIAKNVDMLILQPISAESVAAVVEEAYDAGIIVVNCTSPLAPATDSYNVSVIAKDYDFGYVGMKWLCEKIGGTGNVICLDGMPGLSSAVLRMEGAKDALKEFPNVKIIASEYANWDYATAKPIVENMLASHDKIDAVWSSGGDMTRAAIEVWAESGRDWVPMMGEDCNGFLKLWKKYKDDGLSCIAVSLPTWLFAYGAELGLQIF
jgi:ribose transport system substrate-binding protein